ncbi:MAG: DUF4445 domain-containing protein [Candidatus Thorarchaeota archaeon]|nr:MAG: DUF4445 domain-containing protein [Candidatus Thorarchaeota archaeon]
MEERWLVVFEPSGLRILLDSNTSFLEAARRMGLHIPAECGGKGTCGKCRIILKPKPSPTKIDSLHLKGEDIRRGVRLACEHTAKAHCRAILTRVEGRSKILAEHLITTDEIAIDAPIDGEYGVAIDLGTTTIVAYLLGLKDGAQIGCASMLNPQIEYGEDVVTRITHALQNDEGAASLQSLVVQAIDGLIKEVCEAGQVSSEAVGRISVVGNTAMHHLFLGIDTSSLGFAPYEPAMKHSFNADSKVVGLGQVSAAQVYCSPNIAGFVGGDTVAFILSQRLDQSEDVVLGADIGTNGEIVLSKYGELFCCSAAAGSAFEGATISQGMRGQEGAIEHVTIDDPSQPAEIEVIGGGVPRGICGSGIVDIVSELLKHSLLDEDGRLQESNRIIHVGPSVASYVLVEKGEHDSESRILFTQKDVRQVQLAKSAILAGTHILIREADVALTEIDAVYLAGAFGTYINPESAVSIGLLPAIDPNRVVQVGNAAGDGAKKMLLSIAHREIAEEIADSARYVELASYGEFEKFFIRGTLMGDHLHE